MFLLSCSNNFSGIDYSDFKEQHILKKEQILNSLDIPTYIYSKSCGHCSGIKLTILNFIQENKIPLQLFEFKNNIPITSDRESLIGVDKVEDIAIVGVPSLFIVKDKKIISYLVGGDEIIFYLENFLPIPS